MSSPAGRYQSKVLSFFSRQSQRWVDQSKVAVRTFGDRALWNLRVAATWGSQILLYPIYAVFQTTRLVGRQLQQVVKERLPQLRGEGEKGRKGEGEKERQIVPTTDAPIFEVLAAIEGFEFPELVGVAPVAVLQAADDRPSNLVLRSAGQLMPSTSVSQALAEQPARTAVLATTSRTLTNGAKSGQAQSQRTVIHGVASLLENRHLVLVTVQNQILDILTSEQQNKLRQRIIWEIATYWRQVRSFLAGHKPSKPLLPPTIERPHLLPPVRVFYQLMAWMQESSVAIAINLFQEVRFLPPSQEAGFATTRTPQRRYLPGLDQLLHAGFLEDCEAESWLTYGDLWGEPIENGFVSTIPFTWEKDQEQAISAATIPKLPGETQRTRATLPFAYPVRLAANLTEKLFKTRLRQSQTSGGRVEQPSPTHLVATKKATLAQFRLPVSQAMQKQERSLHRSITPTSSTASRQPAPVQPISRQPITVAPQPSQLATPPLDPAQQTNSPAHHPDWIETDAIVTGYIKHPLERILELIDRALLWLENLTTNLWKWLHQPRRK
jgi:hypothetical protein